MVTLANRWFAKVKGMHTRLRKHWTLPEKVSLVALLDRFKATLHDLLEGVIGDSPYAPVLRQPTDAQHAQLKKLFVGDSKVAFGMC